MSVKIAMLLDHNGAYDSRVVRQALALSNAGYDVVVFCKTDIAAPQKSRNESLTYIDCFFDPHNTRPTLKRTSPQASVTRPRPAPTQNPLKRTLGTALSFHNNLVTVSEAVRHYAPDIIHAHDLSMLPAGRKLSKDMSVPLIYDSHEYEYDRNVIENPVQTRIRRAVERHYISRCDAVITVSDSIADALMRRHKIARPFIVLNTSAGTRPASPALTRKSLDLPDGRMGVYFGGIQPGRGLEQAIDALSFIKDRLCIIGRVSRQQQAHVMSRAAGRGVSDKIFWHAPLSEASIAALKSVFDYALIPIQNTCASYDFALPNKLFQSIATGLPVAATPLAEISAFIRHFNIGTVASGYTGRDIADAILTLQDHTLHPPEAGRFRPYEWAASEAILLSIYKSLTEGRPLPVSTRLPHSHTD